MPPSREEVERWKIYVCSEGHAFWRPEEFEDDTDISPCPLCPCDVRRRGLAYHRSDPQVGGHGPRPMLVVPAERADSRVEEAERERDRLDRLRTQAVEIREGQQRRAEAAEQQLGEVRRALGPDGTAADVGAARRALGSLPSECETCGGSKEVTVEHKGSPWRDRCPDCTEPQPEEEGCRYCDGRGWIEGVGDHHTPDGEYIGSEPIQQPCPACDGTGKRQPDSEGEEAASSFEVGHSPFVTRLATATNAAWEESGRSALDEMFEAVSPRDGSMPDSTAAAGLAPHAWAEVKRLRDLKQRFQEDGWPR